MNESGRARTPGEPHINCSCMDTSSSTPLINNSASFALSLSLFLSPWSPFDPRILSLILRPRTPQHVGAFSIYPPLSSRCRLHSILAETLLFKFTLLSTSVNPSCFPSDLKPSQSLPQLSETDSLSRISIYSATSCQAKVRSEE